MFKTRLISGIILVILAAALIVLGGDLLLIAALAISCIGMFELYRIFHIEKSPLALIAWIAAALYYADLRFEFCPESMMILMACMIGMMFVYVFSYPKYRAKQIMAAFFGLFYVALMLSYVYRIRMLDRGLYLAALIFLCSWGCDTCAYCFGKLFGKHKMSPVLSPKKSVEGAVGGVFGTVVLTVIYCLIFRSQMDLTGMEIALLGVISAAAGLISMVGDLTASAIKRNYDIKDYGNLIPGHGGILDRFDSMIITAPIIYYLALFFLA